MTSLYKMMCTSSAVILFTSSSVLFTAHLHRGQVLLRVWFRNLKKHSKKLINAQPTDSFVTIYFNYVPCPRSYFAYAMLIFTF